MMRLSAMSQMQPRLCLNSEKSVTAVTAVTRTIRCVTAVTGNRFHTQQTAYDQTTAYYAFTPLIGYCLVRLASCLDIHLIT